MTPHLTWSKIQCPYNDPQGPTWPGSHAFSNLTFLHCPLWIPHSNHTSLVATPWTHQARLYLRTLALSLSIAWNVLSQRYSHGLFSTSLESHLAVTPFLRTLVKTASAHRALHFMCFYSLSHFHGKWALRVHRSRSPLFITIYSEYKQSLAPRTWYALNKYVWMDFCST